ncbi:MAG TPA: DUF423 domain-containing protein [Luteimonas sp.]|nr:DUF423 domain-containing protein [Luteimonas sp.]
MTATITQRRAWLAASGAVLAAAAVALAAYANHGVHGVDQSRLQTAAIFAFGNGLALAALAPSTMRNLGQLALLALLLGLLLFSGSLTGSVLARWPTTLAPMGGLLMIAGWLALALDFIRRQER